MAGPSSVDQDIFSRPDAKREFVRRMFDGIAGTYDLLNHVLSLGIDRIWRRLTVDGLAPEAQWRVLDLATGTGDLGFEASGRSLDVNVVGVDLSRPMLQKGVEKANSREGRISFMCGDAESLPFPDGVFDGVTIGFGIRNVANLRVGLREIRRVLKPGGRLAVLEFSKPRAALLSVFYHAYFRHILPRIGRIVSRDPDAYHYLYESVMRFPEGELFCQHLLDTGLVQVTSKRLSFGIATLYIGSIPLQNQSR